ncbi:MAG: FMN-dependent NADH-azoreductase [Wenzhouxiangella sp.]
MKTLLLIKSSLFNGSGQSSKLADEFAERWRMENPGGRLLCRDLAADSLPHLTAEAFAGFQAEATARTPAQQAATVVSDALIAELKQADAVAIGLPMYNFTIPSTFKAWMDHVARAGVTFEYTAEGPRGLVGNKPVFVFAARGGLYQGTPADTQTELVRLFLGMLGIEDVQFTYAEGLAMGNDAADKARSDASERILKLAA